MPILFVVKLPGYSLLAINLKIILITSIVLISGCQSVDKSNKSNSNDRYELVSPGLVNIDMLKFNNPGYWSEQKKEGLVSWTQDGTLLNEIVFGSLNQGQNILGKTGNAAGEFDYEPQMSPNLLVEQFTDALTNSSYHNVILHERIKLFISNQQAVKFKVSYDASSNVNYSAWALFIKHDDKLITIFCSAPTRYYFPMLEDSYLKILNSVEVI